MRSPDNESRHTVNEQARLESLSSYDVLDSPAERVFDEFARLAASIAETPTALVSFVDGTRQWFKARVGLAAEQTPRDVAFCAHAIEGDNVFVVPDATRDPRFAQNPLVTGAPSIRFYAGAPLMTLEGHALGTVCVIDYVPREFSLEQQDALQALSRQVMGQMDLRRRLARFSHEARGGQMVDAILHALEAKEFLLLYQPVVNVRTGEILKLEALLRWNDPLRGLLAPAEFLGAMEESGLIVRVGEWVLQRAANDYLEWAARGISPPAVAVNISPLHLSHPAFLTHLRGAITTGGVHGPRLEIEIADAAITQNPGATIGRLHEVQQLGMQVCIDDFGAGGSLFPHLGRTPVDSVKIDRGLIARSATNPEDRALVEGIIRLTGSLDLVVVAKGVETTAQRRLLQGLGCDFMQGFLLGAPASMEATEHVLRRTHARASVDWVSTSTQMAETP